MPIHVCSNKYKKLEYFRQYIAKSEYLSLKYFIRREISNRFQHHTFRYLKFFETLSELEKLETQQDFYEILQEFKRFKMFHAQHVCIVGHWSQKYLILNKVALQTWYLRSNCDKKNYFCNVYLNIRVFNLYLYKLDHV